MSGVVFVTFGSSVLWICTSLFQIQAVRMFNSILDRITQYSHMFHLFTVDDFWLPFSVPPLIEY